MKNEKGQTATGRLLRVFKKIIIGISVTGVLALGSFVVVSSDHGYLALKRSLQEENQRSETVKASQQRNQELEREIQRLKDDPQWIEKIAREELGLTRPQDTVIKLQKPNDPPQK